MKSAFVPLAAALCAGLLSIPSPGQAAVASGPHTYTITDLGTLGGDNSYALGINNSGVVVGASETGTALHAFKYSSSITDIGTLPSPYNAFSIAYGINSAGQIVGVSGQGSGISRHAFRTGTSGLITSSTDLGALGGPNGPDDSTALAINANGLTVGFSFPAFGQTLQPIEYSTFLSGVTTPSVGVANSVNASGVFVGYTYYSYGFETRQVAYIASGGGIGYLGPTSSTSGGPNSVATAINDNNQVAGYLDYSQSGFGYFNRSHAFSYDASTFTSADLGTTPYADTSQALALNSSGTVVGTAFNSGTSSPLSVNGLTVRYGHGVLFQSGHAYDLNELLTGAGSSSLVVGAATGINNSGRIVGFGTIGGHLHAFLLTPTASFASLPAAPSGLSALPVAGRLQINLAFTDNTGGHALLILERKQGTGAFTALTTLAAGNTTYQDSAGLLAGTTYTYRVKSRTSIGDSAYAVSAPVTTPPAASNVSAQVTVTRTGFRLNRSTGNYVQTVTLTNTGSAAVTGPVSLVLDNLQGNLMSASDGVTVATSPSGNFYINVASGSLAPGGKVSALLQFTPQTFTSGGGEEGGGGTTTTLPITYTTRVLAGTGVR